MKTRIRSLREDNDLTQKQVSSFLNISQVAYSYYEINKRSIPLKLLSKLADFYNTSTDYLLYRTDELAPYAKPKLYKKELYMFKFLYPLPDESIFNYTRLLPPTL